MSADYWLEVDTGGAEKVAITESINVTYNLGPMLRAAGFPPWRDLIGASAIEAAGVLNGVLTRLDADRDRLVAEHTPANGWGSWEWAREFVQRFRDDCAAHPKATIGGWL